MMEPLLYQHIILYILYILYTMEPLLYELCYILHDGAPLIALQTRHLILS